MVVLLFLDAKKRYIVLVMNYKVMPRDVKADLPELVCTILENLTLFVFFLAQLRLKQFSEFSFSVWRRVPRARSHRAPVAQLVEHRDVMREVVSSTPAGPYSGS